MSEPTPVGTWTPLELPEVCQTCGEPIRWSCLTGEVLYVDGRFEYLRAATSCGHYVELGRAA